MKILVGQHELKIDKKDKVNQNEYKVTKCEFEFDEEITDDLVKIALFTNSAGTYKQYIINNECDIPAEILEKQETTTLGVYAYKEENEELELRYSPEEIKFYVSNGSYKENAENTEPITPTDKEQMEQALQNGLNDINDKIDEVDEKLDGIDTAIEETNNLNLDVSDKVDGDVTVTLTKKDASTKTVVLSDGTSLEFNWDGTKLGIKTSDEEEYTYVDLQGIQGPVGPQGEAFRIKKTYSSVAEMNADFNNMEYGDYVMIASSVEVEDNAKLYTRGESQWIFITDFSGATGVRGPVGATPSIQIGTVVSGVTPSVTRTGTDENPVLNFVLQKGDKGDKGNIGDTGNGISSIEKTSTSGLVDTYTITYTNGNTTTFDVSNGNGIDRIEKTATVGNKDTYTIYFTNGSTTTYEVSNGEVTREELEEEVERLNMIYNAFPSTTGEGEEPSINGTAEVPFKEIGLKGNTSQESTTGKNLLSVNFSQSGTNSLATSTFTLPTGTYTFSYSGNLTATWQTTIYSYIEGTRVDLEHNYNQYNLSFTLEEEREIYIEIYRLGILLNQISQPMLNEGSTPLSYEPYTGGNPAPNPDYSYPVNVVTGDNEVKVENKNILPSDISKYDITTGTYGFIKVSDKEEDLMLSLTDKDTSIDISGCYLAFSGNGVGIADGGKFIINSGNKITDSLNNISGNRKFQYVSFYPKNEATFNKIFSRFNVMVERNTTATRYEEHKEQTYPINLGSMELCKIGDYQDYIYKENGNWYKYGAIGKVVLDGTEDGWVNISGNAPYKYENNNFPTFTDNETLLSNYYEGKKWNDSWSSFNYLVVATRSGKAIQFRNVDISSLADFKTWLGTHNTTLYYVLATPTITEITDTTLIEQLDNLEKAYSYDTQTNISQTNQDKPFIISYEAILSLRNVLNS